MAYAFGGLLIASRSQSPFKQTISANQSDKMAGPDSVSEHVMTPANFLWCPAALVLKCEKKQASWRGVVECAAWQLMKILSD
jgi:hypothetical protein